MSPRPASGGRLLDGREWDAMPVTASTGDTADTASTASTERLDTGVIR